MVPRDRTRAHVLGLAALLAIVPALGHAADGGVGTRVVQKNPKLFLKVGKQAIDPKGRIAIYRVEAVQGPWLWLQAPGLGGWAKAADVVPLDRAIDHFTGALNANPRDVHAYTLRAIVWYDRKELDAALGDYNEALRLKPDAARFNNRSVIWREKKQFGRALADLAEAIRLNPTYTLAYYNRGLLWQERKEFDRARADYDTVIRLNPNDATAYNNRGGVRHDLKDFDGALADYAQALRLAPQLAAAHHNRAWLLATCPDARHRDGKQAVESATRACELTDWNDAIKLDTLAAAAAEAGDFNAAIKWHSKALELLPKDHKEYEASLARLELYREGKPYRDEPRTP